MRAVPRLIVGGLLSVITVLVPAAVGADTLRADLDGDGVRDHIDVDVRFTELEVRLSKSRALQRLRANDLILRFVVADIDRDGDPDVVADTRRTGLQIWINTGRGLFAARSSKVHGLRRAGRTNIGGASYRRSDDSDCNDQTRELVAACNPRGQPLLSSRRAAASGHPRESCFEHSPRIARGPPSDSPRPHTSVA